LKAEVAELLARAEAADQADVSDGMSIPEELARREERFRSLPRRAPSVAHGNDCHSSTPS
jgi:hypothetical protein